MQTCWHSIDAWSLRYWCLTTQVFKGPTRPKHQALVQNLGPFLSPRPKYLRKEETVKGGGGKGDGGGLGVKNLVVSVDWII